MKQKTPRREVGLVSLKKEEDYQLKSKTDETGDKSTADSKKPIVPILLGFIIGGILGKLLILLFKIIGIL